MARYLSLGGKNKFNGVWIWRSKIESTHHVKPSSFKTDLNAADSADHSFLRSSTAPRRLLPDNNCSSDSVKYNGVDRFDAGGNDAKYVLCTKDRGHSLRRITVSTICGSIDLRLRSLLINPMKAQICTDSHPFVPWLPFFSMAFRPCDTLNGGKQLIISAHE